MDLKLSLRLIGIALIAHGAIVTWATTQPKIAVWAKLNIAAIGPYPLIMAVVAATGIVSRPLGQALLILDGAIVGALAIAQWRGLRAGITSARPILA